MLKAPKADVSTNFAATWGSVKIRNLGGYYQSTPSSFFKIRLEIASLFVLQGFQEIFQRDYSAICSEMVQSSAPQIS